MPDLNTVAEDFFADLLNEVFGLSLVTLNHTQLNIADIDLRRRQSKDTQFNQAKTQRYAAPIVASIAIAMVEQFPVVRPHQTRHRHLLQAESLDY